MANRIDAEFVSFESNNIKRELTEKSKELYLLMDIILKELDNPKGLRLAYYVDSLLPEQSNDGFNSVYHNQNLGISVQDSSDCTEWMHRSNTHVKLNTGIKEEVCNSIIALESAMLNTQNTDTRLPMEVKGVRISADINTLAENMEERFHYTNMMEFCNSAQILYLDVLEQILALFLG